MGNYTTFKINSGAISQSLFYLKCTILNLYHISLIEMSCTKKIDSDFQGPLSAFKCPYNISFVKQDLLTIYPS